MRRIAVIGALAAAVAALLAAGVAAGDGEGGDYKVRAIFDNGAFLIPGEDVRIAGATVGVVDSVDVTGADEAVHEDGSPEPGKAVVVIRIDEAGFQDFRADASCLIRPQSLLGEKYVDCLPTQPRAAGQPAPPELEVIEEGEAGEGEHFLPLENNGKAVDLDLVNNINREPYAERLRLILNDLGAGFAARGEELADIIERANPALKQTDRVLAILARQNRTLAKLARDGDQIMAAWARERERFSGFINNAETTAAATAERNPDLEASLERFPAFLRELRLTMAELRRFSDVATPTFSDLGAAAPALTRATQALGPFASAGIPAFRTLGDAVEQAGPDLIASEPLIEDLRRLGNDTTPTAKALARLLGDLRRTGGYRQLLEFVYYTVGGTNGFDQYGHFLRAQLPFNDCTQYNTGAFGCLAHFQGSGGRSKVSPASASAGPMAAIDSLGATIADAVAGETTVGDEPVENEPVERRDAQVRPRSEPDQSTDSVPFESEPTSPSGTEPKLERTRTAERDARMLMGFFLGGER
jgi:ABC-type transporter Mla subunit MlaD